MSQLRGYLLAYLALAAAAAVAIGSFNVPRFLALSEHSLQTDGLVVQSTCGDHGTLHYRFHANGRDFAGHGLADGNCASVQPGNQVVVYYLPDQPEISMLRPPRGALENELFSVAAAATVAPGFLLAVYGSQRRPRRRQPA